MCKGNLPITAVSSTATQLCNGIEISALDERQYKCITLDNALQVLLISDPHTEKASAAMDVHVGHQSDPEALPGLAHFLEHMLFLGTAKYPDENSYKEFLSAHSGRSNASTSQMHTNYYFDVLPEHFHEALDRFAQFFIAPLFTPSATDREMQAVDAENAKNLQNDHRRLYQLQKALANPMHPFHKFGTGNLETLGILPKQQGVDVREALLAFHAEYYSASIMKLVLLGQQTLDELTQWAMDLFSAIKNTGRSFPTFGNVIPYDETRLPRQIEVTPVKDLRTIDVAWPFPSLYEKWETKPSRILSHLLGHESKGSILSLLKANKWANGLSAGLTRDNEDWSLFSVKIEATEDGIAHYQQVVAVVYQYLEMLRSALPLPQWIFQETKDLAAVEFRFKSKETPIHYTSFLAGVMHKYPAAQIVSGSYLLYQYDEPQVEALLRLMTPERMRLTIVSKIFDGKTTSIEKWYGTPYTERTLETQDLETWKQVIGSTIDGPPLALPHQNEFICTDFTIVTSPTLAPATPSGMKFDPPVVLRQDELCRLWFKPDTQFRKPKLSVSLLLYSPMVAATPYHAVLSSLFVRYLKDELTEFSYDAELSGMDYSLSFTTRAIELHVAGFSQKVPTLLFKILEHMVALTDSSTSYSDAVFERLKDRTRRQYENFFLEEPYQHAMYASSLLLETTKWSIEEKIQAIQAVTLQDLVLHAQVLTQQLFVEAFVYGNAEQDQALGLGNAVVQHFSQRVYPLTPTQRHTKPRIVQLSREHEYQYARTEWNTANKNSAICNLYQIDQESHAQRARLEVLAHVMKEPCFNQLRTKEQLGYLVFSGVMREERIEYLRVLIQSNVASPMVLNQRIEAFLHQFRESLVEMTTATFHKHVKAVVKALREKPKRESEESMRLWREIASETFVFDRRERIASLVETLHLHDIVAFFDAFMGSNGSKRSKLSVQIYGNMHPLVKTSNELNSEDQVTMAMASVVLQPSSDKQKLVVIDHIETFKQHMPLFPEQPTESLSTTAIAKL